MAPTCLPGTDATTRVSARRHAWLWAAWACPICCGPARRRAASAPDTSVILFWMWGGPSQLETYDCKPDAPSEYRGPFRPIKTTVPGLDICELFPLQARLGHRMSLIRSLHHKMSSHNDGSIELLTGKTPAKDDPDLDGQQRASRFRHDRQPAARLARQRLASLCRHSARAVHDAADLPGHGPLGLRDRRSVGGRIFVRRICRSTRASTARGSTTAASLVAARPLPPRPRPARRARGHRSVSPAGLSTADQHGRGRRLCAWTRKSPRRATAMAGTCGAKAACWPAGWPRPAPA